ncbi:MAG TPA: response regulator [Ktedonobacteraceae bacterium]|jgi:CheY-like chemotaxis protein|nr:response regulator [Ktedonobacteraceae bacterium]
MAKSILIVDDEPDILYLLHEMLTEEGFRVQNSTSGMVYQHIQLAHPDLILLDIFLKETDGRILCKKLKNNTRTRDIPVILFSAHASREEALKESEADDFFAKPFSQEELFAIVKKHLSS